MTIEYNVRDDDRRRRPLRKPFQISGAARPVNFRMPRQLPPGSNGRRGWAGNPLVRLFRSKEIAVPIKVGGASIKVLNDSGALTHSYHSARGFREALRVAYDNDNRSGAGASIALDTFPLNVAGSSDAYSCYATAGTAVPPIRCALMRVSVSASDLNNAYPKIQIDIGTIVNTAGVLGMASPILSLGVESLLRKLDVLVLIPSVGVGSASVVEGSFKQGLVAGASSNGYGVCVRAIPGGANYIVSMEPINDRDLQARPRVGSRMLDESGGSNDDDSVLDMGEAYDDDANSAFADVIAS